ncbi:hypothetical protein VTO42DRAFT_7427 [Malbranchea cinnamomea]
MSIKHAFARIRRPSFSDSDLVSGRKGLSQALSERKEYVYSSDDVLSDEDSPTLSKKGKKRRSRSQRRSGESSGFSFPYTTSAETRFTDGEPSPLRETFHFRSNEGSPSSDRWGRETPEAEDTDEMKARYGDLPLMQSRDRPRQKLTRFDSITIDSIGEEITFRARLHVVRRMGSKLVFMVFRQQITTLQGVLTEEKNVVSMPMIRWAEHIRAGSIVRVKGQLRQPLAPVSGTTIHHVELHIRELHVIVRRDEYAPFSVYEAELALDGERIAESKSLKIPDRTRLSNRILDLRTDVAQSIFRIQSAIGNLFRAALDARGFIEIHTPKLQGSATESGASVFRVNYFNRPAFLAQSPQLAKQMAIAADFERVYEIGAVFRAENSNTHRHLTEYTGLDIEMAIEEHYHEALEVLDSVLKEIFQGIYSKYRREIEIIKQHVPHEDLVWLDETPIIPFAEGIKMLNDSGWTDESGKPLSEDEDLGTRDEIRLGELVKEKYKTDYFILDKFPVSARPFYAMLDPDNPRVTNSFDVFVRGQEIVSGGQRIHDASMLEERMRRTGVDPATMEEYIEGFRWGAPPHAGAGIGLERLLMLILKLNNIRFATLFHRDPKTFSLQSQQVSLRHPESSTLNPPWQASARLSKSGTDEERKMQPLEELIANYGDSTATSWLDDRYKIWRDYATGAAVSYVPSHGYAIIAGDPLCDRSQFAKIVPQFLRWLKKETKLKPIWILCSLDVEEILGEKFGWRSLSCVAEERVDPNDYRALSDAEVARKIRRAENEGVKVTSFPSDQPVPEELKQKIDARIQDWLANREGTQIHLSEIAPWRDQRHRRYFYATDKNGQICSFVTLAELAPRYGMQVKYSLDFPGSPSGSIEYIITQAIQAVAKMGVKSLTFGSGAAARLTPGHNIGSTKAKVLQHTYDTLMKQFKLNRKSEFRAKMGAYEEPTYIAYPRHGLGTKGIRAIMSFFED